MMTSQRLAQFKAWLESSELEPLRVELQHIHPADLAEIIDELEVSQRRQLFDLLPPGLASETLRELDEAAIPEILEGVEGTKVGQIFEELPHDDAADILRELPAETSQRILLAIGKEDVADIEALLKFDEESAGGIMTTEVLAVREDLTADEAIQEIRKRGQDQEEFYALFVIDHQNVLTGTVTLHHLIVAEPGARVGKLMKTEVVSVLPHEDREQVARLMARYNLVVLPVVDEFGHLLGRVTADDVFDILEEEATEDILRLGGVPAEEEIEAGPLEAVRARLPWLYLNLATAFLAAWVVSLFQETIQQFVILAVWMPVIAGMGGNAGTQALAVTVRRLVLAEIDRARGLRILKKELLVGLLNGLAIALIVSLIALWWGKNPYLGLVVGLAMWLNLAIAGLAGALIPLSLRVLGVDPAIASSIFVTTFTDVGGFFFLLGLATLFLAYLL